MCLEMCIPSYILFVFSWRLGLFYIYKKIFGGRFSYFKLKCWLVHCDYFGWGLEYGLRFILALFGHCDMILYDDALEILVLAFLLVGQGISHHVIYGLCGYVSIIDSPLQACKFFKSVHFFMPCSILSLFFFFIYRIITTKDIIILHISHSSDYVGLSYKKITTYSLILLLHFRMFIY